MPSAPSEPPATVPCPTVLLRHERPDGSVHVDWLIAREPAAETPLIAFRLNDRLDRLEPASRPPSLAGERIADHRAVYLTYEGDLDRAPGGSSTPGRGRVRRLRRGVVVAWTVDPGGWSLAIDWHVGPDPSEAPSEGGSEGGSEHGAAVRRQLVRLEPGSGNRSTITAV